MEASIVERAIRKNYTKQLHYLQVTEILGMLYEREVIGRLLKEQIEAESNPLRKRTLLLDHVSLQPLQVLQTYCAILEDSARTDCLHIHKQIAEGIRCDLVKSAVPDTEKDSTPFRQTVENCTKTLQKRIFKQDAENSLQCLPTARSVQEEHGRELSTAHSKNDTSEASKPLPVPIAHKQDVVPLHNKLTREGNGFMGVVTMTTSVENLEFVEHMYGCFDYIPSDREIGTDIDNMPGYADMEATTCTELKGGGYEVENAEKGTKREVSDEEEMKRRSRKRVTTYNTDFTYSHYPFIISVAPIKPSGPLKSKTHRKLVQMLWSLRSSEPEKAETALDVILMKKGLPLDIKLACLDAGLCSATQNLPRLKKALEECDKAECQNPLILKCRLHIHIAGCYLSAYIGVGGVDMKKHMQCAFELSTQISGDYAKLRGANCRSWVDFMEAKHCLSEQKMSDILTHVDNSLQHYKDMPGWMRPDSAPAFLSRAFMEMKKAELHKCRNIAHLQASLILVESVMVHLHKEELVQYLDRIHISYYYHISAVMMSFQGDYPKAAEYGQLACNQYIQNSMFQRALQLAGQLHSSELEQQVMQAIKRRGSSGTSYDRN